MKKALFLLIIAASITGCQHLKTVEPMSGAARFGTIRIVQPIAHIVYEVPRDRVIRPAVKRYNEAERVGD